VRLERGRAGAALEQGFVVRADSAGGPFPPVPLEYEYQVYVHLARTEIPVARPLWFDASPEPSDGRALFVREMVEGSTLLPGLGDDTDAAAEPVCEGNLCGNKRRETQSEGGDLLLRLCDDVGSGSGVWARCLRGGVLLAEEVFQGSLGRYGIGNRVLAHIFVIYITVRVEDF